MEDVSPSTASQEFESSPGKQHRKAISTGGGRAWSQEEVRHLANYGLSSDGEVGKLSDRDTNA